MPQVDDWSDINANTTDGTTYVRQTDDRREALRSLESGNTAPVNPVTGMFWLDTSNLSFPHLRQYRGTGWISVWVMDVANGRIRMLLDNDRDSYIAPTGTDGQIGIWIEGQQAFTYGPNGLKFGGGSVDIALDMSGKTTAVWLPAGTTAQRPDAASYPGALRYNTDTARIEQSVSSTWVNVPVPSDIVRWTRGTAVNVGTTAKRVEFTGIPAGTRIVMLAMARVKTQGNVAVQIGDSGGIETSNYINDTSAQSTERGYLEIPTSGYNTQSSVVRMVNIDGNMWVLEDIGFTNSFVTVKTLSGTLDRVLVGGVPGSNTGVEASNISSSIPGVINILYQ